MAVLPASSTRGTPIFKPWRVMVSDVHLVAAIGGFKCSGDHLHRKCGGGQRVAQTAYYPPRLCGAIHKGFDAHEAARALCSPCYAAGPAAPASSDGPRASDTVGPAAPASSDGPRTSEGAGLRPDRREAVHIGRAPGRVDSVPVPDNTEVRSCCGTVPDRSIRTCIRSGIFGWTAGE